MNILQRFLLKRIYTNSMQLNFLQNHGMIIGKGCDIQNPANYIDTDFDKISIGNNVTVASSALLLPHDGSLRVLSGTIERAEGRLGILGLIKIHDNCFIGANAIILPGVEVGPNSIVGAGAVVSSTIPPDSIYGGNPARLICTIEQLKRKIDALPKVYRTITNSDDICGKVVRVHGIPQKNER